MTHSTAELDGLIERNDPIECRNLLRDRAHIDVVGDVQAIDWFRWLRIGLTRSSSAAYDLPNERGWPGAGLLPGSLSP
jgi:hypothetical protein